MFFTLQGPNGEPIPAHSDAQGNLLISPAPATTTTVALQPWTPVNSTAYEGARVLKASQGILRSCFIQLDPSVATGTYYAQLLIAAAVPADGAVTFLRPPYAIAHTNGTPSEFAFDEGDSGIVLRPGALYALAALNSPKLRLQALPYSREVFCEGRFDIPWTARPGRRDGGHGRHRTHRRDGSGRAQQSHSGDRGRIATHHSNWHAYPC